MLKVPKLKTEVAFQSYGRHPASYVREMFLLMVALLHTALVSYGAGPSTLILPLNLKNQCEFLLHQKFAEIYLKDCEAI